MSRVGIVCRLNATNVGDSAMYDNLVAHLPSGWEAFPITDSEGAAQACLDVGYEGATTEDTVDFARCDAVLVGGGDFDPTVAADRIPRALPVACLGLSFGTRRLDSAAYRGLLQCAALVYTRDRLSADLARLVGAKDAVCTCDLAWDLALPPHVQMITEPVFVTLRAPTRLPPEPGWRAEVARDAVEALTEAGIPWDMLPCNVDDAEWSHRAGLPRGLTVPRFRPGDAAWLRARVTLARAIVTVGRYHPAVFAASQGVPVLGVAMRAVQAGPKMHGLFDLLSLRHLCLDADTADEGALRDAVRRVALGQTPTVTHEPDLSHWDALRAFLTGGA